jgi:hypothetical protein
MESGWNIFSHVLITKILIIAVIIGILYFLRVFTSQPNMTALLIFLHFGFCYMTFFPI